MATKYKLIDRIGRQDSGVPVSLRFQLRTTDDIDWHVLSWRSRYDSGANRRFYVVHGEAWWIGNSTASAMIEEAAVRGWLKDAHLDRRRRPECLAVASHELPRPARDEYWASMLLPGETARDAEFLICEDSNQNWRKVAIRKGARTTFRSITADPEYSPRKHLDNGLPWDLDNSMMDFNVQQARRIHAFLNG